MSNMENQIELSEDEVLCCELSDAALENAAMVGHQNAGAVTLSFCTGLETCPA